MLASLRRAATRVVLASAVITAVVIGAAWGGPPASAHELTLRTVHRGLHPVALVTHADSVAQFDTSARAVRAAEARRGAAAPARIAQASLPYVSDQACGPELTTDDAANATDRIRPVYKAVYAYPLDLPDNYARYAPVIARLVADAAGAIMSASSGQLGIRVDRGTACGPQYLDITSLRLPRPITEYTGTQAFDRIVQDVNAALGDPPAGQKVNRVVFVDGVQAAIGAGGQGTMWEDDSPGPTNLSNSGGSFAMLYGTGESWFASESETWSAHALLHEVFHTLGAVQSSAPHATANGHCWQEWDILCYADGGPRMQPVVYDCAGDDEHAALDCGVDDYFAMAPPAGSYLATHWNARDNVFLCPIARCSQPPVAPSPVIAALPSAVIGSTVAIDATGSHDDGRVTTYAWQFGRGLEPLGDTDGVTVRARIRASGARAVRLTVTDDEGLTAGAQVTFSVACRVPRVLGMTARRAASRLRRAGCAARVSGTRRRTRVEAQVPRCGSIVASGSRVLVRLVRPRARDRGQNTPAACPRSSVRDPAAIAPHAPT